MAGARFWLLTAACLLTRVGHAAEPPDCHDQEVLAHVRDQFELYGPRALHNEFFGFIYLKDGHIDSAVTRGTNCRGADCTVNTAFAARRIPAGSKVLGEWHTHPQLDGSRLLSAEDVRGARANLHIRCYRAYYSAPDGDVWSWDLASTSVPVAMDSRVLLFNFREPDPSLGAAIIAAHNELDQSCLSTNTNVPNAATTKRCSSRSTTSR